MATQPAYRNTTYQAVLAALVLLMVYAAASKAFGFQRFLAQLGKQPLIGAWKTLIGSSLIVLELLAALLLLFPKTQRKGLLACLLLLTVFTLYILAMLLWLPKLPCSCGGIIEHLGWKGHIVFNLFFIGLCCYGLYLHRTGMDN